MAGWVPVVLAFLLAGVMVRPTSATSTVPVEEGTAESFLANDTDPALGMAWVDPPFDDSGWSRGPVPIGTDAGPMVQTEVPLGTRSVFVRIWFDLADTSAVQTLHLGCDYDDGYAVWLNGQEVFRSPELPAGPLAWDTPPSSDHESSNGVLPDYRPRQDLSAHIDGLVPGPNLLAIGIWNAEATASDLVVAPELAINRPVGLTRGPYLQLGTHQSVVVRWRTDVPTTSRVDYGDASGNLTQSVVVPGSRTEHEVELSGLTPDTRIHYAVYSSAGRIVGDDGDHWFVTAPAPGSSRPTRIWVLGDSGTANLDARNVRDGYLQWTGTTHTDLWLMLGDNAYDDGTDPEYQQALFNMYPGMLRRSVLWPCVGNHDAFSSSALTQSGPYYDMFTLPANAEAGGLASGTEAYYSFDFGDIHFVVLESMESDRTPDGPMMTWLGADLAQTSARWVIAYWHHPPYSKGSHDSDTEHFLYEMREIAVPILEAHGVDLVLAGHSHSFERSHLVDGHYGFSWTFHDSMLVDGGDGRIGSDGAYRKPVTGMAPRAGAVYIVAGASGKTNTGTGTLDHPVMFHSQEILGSVVLDIDDDQLTFRYLNSTGGAIDSFTILRSDPNAVSAPDPGRPAGIDGIRPNPAPGPTVVHYTLGRRLEARLRVYDLRGRLVSETELGVQPPGSHAWGWDGRDTDGRRVAQGTYLVELRTPDGVDRSKVTILR